MWRTQMLSRQRCSRAAVLQGDEGKRGGRQVSGLWVRFLVAQAVVAEWGSAADVCQNPAGGNHLWSACGLMGSAKDPFYAMGNSVSPRRYLRVSSLD